MPVCDVPEIEFFMSLQLLFGPLLASYFQNFPLFFFKSFYLTGTQGGMEGGCIFIIAAL